MLHSIQNRGLDWVTRRSNVATRASLVDSTKDCRMPGRTASSDIPDIGTSIKLYQRLGQLASADLRVDLPSISRCRDRPGYSVPQPAPIFLNLSKIPLLPYSAKQHLPLLSSAMTERLQQFLSHLKPDNATGLAALSQKNPDDVVITLAVRTPLTKARKGGLKDTTLEHMLLRLYEVQSS
jgi:hypothetical protein